jgi:hypothetical protein
MWPIKILRERRYPAAKPKLSRRTMSNLTLRIEKQHFLRKTGEIFPASSAAPSRKALVPQAVLRLGISGIFLSRTSRKSASARMDKNLINSQAIAFQ